MFDVCQGSSPSVPIRISPHLTISTFSFTFDRMAAGAVARSDVPAEAVDDLQNRLRSCIESKTGFADAATQAAELNKLFRSHNPSRDGWINLEEFASALVKLNFVGVQKQIEGLFYRYADEYSGCLSYQEFSAQLFSLIPNVHGDPKTRSAVERMRRAVAKRGGLNGIRSLSRMLRIMDDNGNKRLDREELKYGLRDFGMECDDRDVEAILNAFDRNRDGQIDFDELLRGLKGKINRRRAAVIQLAFDQLDKDDSGVVDMADVEAAYDTSEHPDVISGKKTREEVLSEFMSQWDTLEKDGVISRAEFFDYYKDVSASVDDDEYFELMVVNAWHITDGDVGAMNTSNKRCRVVFLDGREEVVMIKDDLGLDLGDYQAVKARLQRQGLSGIKEIHMAD